MARKKGSAEERGWKDVIRVAVWFRAGSCRTGKTCRSACRTATGSTLPGFWPSLG
jgi:hypothetical protein